MSSPKQKWVGFEFSLTEPLGLGLGHSTLEVKDIVKGSQAAKLQVEAGWIVLKVGVENVDNYDDFQQAIQNLKLMNEDSALFLFKIPDKIIHSDVLASSKLLYFNMCLKQPLGLELSHDTLAVKSVTAKSQASQLGIVKGCRVVKIGQDTVSTFDEFMTTLQHVKEEAKLEKVLILLKIPELNSSAYNKDNSKFRPSVFENENEVNKISISGNLMKRGNNVMNPWQTRYFVAENHYLRYYKSEKVCRQAEYCLAAIDLDLCDIKDAHKNMFDLIFKTEDESHKKEKLTFKAKNNSSAKKWVETLRALHKEYGHQQIAAIDDDDDVEDYEMEEDEEVEDTLKSPLSKSKSMIVPSKSQTTISYDQAIAQSKSMGSGGVSSTGNAAATATTTTTTTAVTSPGASVNIPKGMGAKGRSASMPIAYDALIASQVTANTDPRNAAVSGGGSGSHSGGNGGITASMNSLSVAPQVRSNSVYSSSTAMPVSMDYNTMISSQSQNSPPITTNTSMSMKTNYQALSPSMQVTTSSKAKLFNAQASVPDVSPPFTTAPTPTPPATSTTSTTWPNSRSTNPPAIPQVETSNSTQSSSSFSSYANNASGGGDGVSTRSNRAQTTTSISSTLSMLSPLPDKRRLSHKPSMEETKRKEVPQHLKPSQGEVNPLSKDALATAPVGQERKVSRRRSVTSRKCLISLYDASIVCQCFHFRDSPFCHEHASYDPESLRVNAGGTSELEDILNKALETALDHSMIAYPAEAYSVGEAVRSSLPPDLSHEFSDPYECFQLQKQFKAFLAFSGDNGDGKLQAKEILGCAQQIGDDLDPAKVNLEWANTLVAGVLGRDDNSPGDNGIDLFHFMRCIQQMRKSMKVDASNMMRKVKKLKERNGANNSSSLSAAAAAAEYDDDSDDDADEYEENKWHFPIHIPNGATPGTILTVPLPGGDLNYLCIEKGQQFGEVVKLSMNDMHVNACVKQAVQEAADGATISSAARFDGMAAGQGGGGGGGRARNSSVASSSIPTISGAPPYQPGIGAQYAAMKGRQRFCLNAFLALREASALAVDLPPMEGWMLKRGDAMSIGYLNSWKLRYFRLEGNELVYYEKEPLTSAYAEESFSYPKSSGAGGGGGEMDQEVLRAVREKAAEEGREPTDKEMAKAMLEAQGEMSFDNENCKGAINMSEIVDIQFSTKTAVSVSAAKLFINKVPPGSNVALLNETMDGEDIADSMVVFKVTTAKMRRYVLSVPYEQVIPVMILFSKHVHFARSSLRFRREFGSGVRQGLTLGEKIQWVASNYGARLLLAGLLVVYENKYFKENVLGYTLFSIGPIKVTPARIITSIIVTKTVHEIYIASKYADREKKYGIKWQYKRDVFDCFLCQTKFPTIALRIEFQKHHCRMCGRVVCHACSSTMLFYPASGKRQRTCDFCISNGGPPEYCKANVLNQKSVLQLAMEAKKASDAQDKKKAAKAGGAPPSQNTIYEVVREENKQRVSEYAKWTDWGFVPDPKAGGGGGIMSIPTHSTPSSSNGGSVLPPPIKFFVPSDAQAGDTIEVTLPDGVNKVITYVESQTLNDKERIQVLTLEFGQDGVYFAKPPQKGHDLRLIESAKQKRDEELKQAAEMLVQGVGVVKDLAGSAQDVSKMMGINMAPGNFKF